ncbi:MAG: CIA30 family protein [Chitinispirillaceae bacterium]
MKKMLLFCFIALGFSTSLHADLLLCDFENGEKDNTLGGYWFTYDDVKNNGGNSVTTPFINYQEDSGNRCGHFQYTLGSAYEHRFSGMATNTGSTTPSGKGSSDFSEVTAINLRLRGSGHKLYITFQSPEYDNSNMWVYNINSTPDTWTEYTINIPGDLQEAFTSGSKPVKDWDLMKSSISAIQFKAASKVAGETGFLYVDDINIIGTARLNPVVAKPPAARGDIFECDFDNEPAGTYTWEQVKAAWNEPVSENGVSDGRCSIVDNEHALEGKSLRVSYPSSNGGYGTAATGAQWFLYFENGGAYDSIYAQYWIRFPDGFDFARGGKLPGLGGGTAPTGGQPVTGLNGFTNRLMWRSSSSGADDAHGYGVVYSYCYNKPSELEYGWDLWWDHPTNSIYEDPEMWSAPGKAYFEPGKWHRVKQFVKINTPGVADGAVKTWLDGKLVQQCDTLVYLKELDEGQQYPFKVDMFYFSTFFGGGDESWATPVDQHIYFDNFIISENDPSPEDISPVVFLPEDNPAGTDLSVTQTNGICRLHLAGHDLSEADIVLLDLKGRLIDRFTGDSFSVRGLAENLGTCLIRVESGDMSFCIKHTFTQR